MKTKILVLLLTTLSWQMLFSQDCGVIGNGELMGAKQEPFYSKFARPSKNAISRRGGQSISACKTAVVNVVVHYLHRDDGSGGIQNPNFTTDLMQQINGIFNPYGITLYLKKEMQESNEKIYNTYTSIERVKSFDLINGSGKFDEASVHPNGDAIDIYFNYSALGLKSGIAVLGGTSLIVFGNENSSTLPSECIEIVAHELGHCFTLQHTFFGTACNVGSNINRPVGACKEGEKFDANGNYIGNGATCGDYVEDTPPDPTQSFSQVNSTNCQNNLATLFDCDIPSKSVDIFNTPYHPLENNYMDYINYNCMSSFTSGQVKKMLQGLADLQNTSLQATLIKTLPATVTLTPSIFPLPTTICTGTPLSILANNATDYNLTWSGDGIDYGDVSVISPSLQQSTIFTLNATSNCYTPQTLTISIPVNDGVVFNPIQGPETICKGISVNFTNTFVGGTWSSDNNSVLQINAINGASNAISDGTAIIKYKVSTANCSNIELDKLTKTINVVSNNITAGINASSTIICSGDKVTLNATGTKGLTYTWYNDAAKTNVIGTGVNIDVLPQNSTTNTIIIKYYLVGETPCNNKVDASVEITVKSLPDVQIITPLPDIICGGGDYPINCSPWGEFGIIISCHGQQHRLVILLHQLPTQLLNHTLQ